MLHLYPVFVAQGVYQIKPLLHAFVQLHATAELHKLFAFYAHMCRTGFFEHQPHVAQHVAGVVLGFETVVLGPELLAVLDTYGFQKVVLLHVERREGAVEIVDKRHYGLFC